jgi:hypothetical protein
MRYPERGFLSFLLAVPTEKTGNPGKKLRCPGKKPERPGKKPERPGKKPGMPLHKFHFLKKIGYSITDSFMISLCQLI